MFHSTIASLITFGTYYVLLILKKTAMEGDGEQALVKKRGRGRNQIKEKFNEKGKTLEIDKFYRPVITPDTTSFSTEFGILVRKNISIKYQRWKDVPEEDKQRIWETLKVNNMVLINFTSFHLILTNSKFWFLFVWQLDWGIQDDQQVQKYYYQRMATCHRKWRTEMTRVWREGGTPDFVKEHIEPQDWEIFVGHRETEAFTVCLFLFTTYLTYL
jgi:hypothetical protein